tara:strand:+ start:764 stop:940 length:177 start_codon:yes stop_codon:yes gene_type:complete
VRSGINEQNPHVAKECSGSGIDLWERRWMFRGDSCCMEKADDVAEGIVSTHVQMYIMY